MELWIVCNPNQSPILMDMIRKMHSHLWQSAIIIMHPTSIWWPLPDAGLPMTTVEMFHQYDMSLQQHRKASMWFDPRQNKAFSHIQESEQQWCPWKGWVQFAVCPNRCKYLAEHRLRCVDVHPHHANMRWSLATCDLRQANKSKTKLEQIGHLSHHFLPEFLRKVLDHQLPTLAPKCP